MPRLTKQGKFSAEYMFILGLVIVYFSPVIFQNKTFYAFDTIYQYLPWSSAVPGVYDHNPLITDPVNLGFNFNLLAERRGQQSYRYFWNNSIMCGIPNSSGLSNKNNPLAFVLFLLFSPTTAHDLLLGITLLATGFFMFRYLNAIGLLPQSCLVGAIAWMFNGYLMVWFEYEFILILACSLPAALLFIERWFQNQTAGNILAFAFSIAFAVTSGFAHILIYQLIFITIYLIYRFSLAIKTGWSFSLIKTSHVYYLVGALFSGVLISANFIISHHNLISDGQRTSFSFEKLYLETGQLPLKYFTTILFPNFFGSPVDPMVIIPRQPGAQIYNNYNELCIYSGIATILLAIGTLTLVRTRRWVPFYWISAIIALASACGSFIYYPLARWMPGLGFSSPTRILYVYGFAVAVLAGIGVDDLFTEEKIGKRRLLFLWGILVVAAASIAGFVQSGKGLLWATEHTGEVFRLANDLFLKKHYNVLSPALGQPLVLIILSSALLVSAAFCKGVPNKKFVTLAIMGILSYDLVSFAYRYNTVSPIEMGFPLTDSIRFLQQDHSKFRIAYIGNYLHNCMVPFGIEDIGGYTNLYPRRYGEYIHLSQYDRTVKFPEQFGKWISFKNFDSPLLDLINTKYFLFPPGSRVANQNLKTVYDKEMTIYENLNCFQRCFFVYDFKYCRNATEVLDTLAQWRRTDFRQKVILVEEPERDNNSFQSTRGNEVKARINIIRYDPDLIEIEVDTQDRGYLVVGDTHDKGWKATVDGAETRLYRANHIMRAVSVSGGKHFVRIQYKPRLLAVAGKLTLSGWVFIALIAAWYGLAAWMDKRGQKAREM